MSQANSSDTTDVSAAGGEQLALQLIYPALTGLARQQQERLETLRTLASLRKQARIEISRLIDFLDRSDPYVMTELEEDDDREDIGDREPDLGAFDRMTDQTKSWRQIGACFDIDAEHDTAESEPSLGAPERHPQVPLTFIGYTGTVVVYGPAGEYRDATGSQARWSDGHSSDRESDAEDEHCV